MGAKEKVNHNKRQRGYGARDKERIIESITKLHEEGFSQSDIAKMLNISRTTIKMCDDLIKMGIMPRKTGCETWIDFGNEKLQWAYLRGFFDADGHIRVYKRDGYQKARMGFTGNPDMLASTLLFFKNQGFAKKVNSITPKQGCSDLYLSSVKEIKEIAKKLYEHGDIKLNRKYEKFLSLMI